LSQLVVGLCVLRLELGTLRRETFPQLLDLGDRSSELVQTDVEVSLLLLEFLLLLVEQTDIMIDAEQLARGIYEGLTSRGNVSE
jgi:hypothetical protein